MLTDTIRAAQRRGEVRPGDPALLARVVWALAHGASMLQRDRVEPQFIRFSNEVLRSGLNDAYGPIRVIQPEEILRELYQGVCSGL
jgi:hypothetical protein